MVVEPLVTLRGHGVSPESAEGGVFCEDGCHQIKPKYGIPQKARRSEGKLKETEAAIHFK